MPYPVYPWPQPYTVQPWRPAPYRSPYYANQATGVSFTGYRQSTGGNFQ